MALMISCQDVSKSFGARPLFQGVSFSISDDDKIGMIGPNGSGKSTLLKILSGIEHSDHGDVIANKNARVGYLPQDDVFDPEATVREVLLSALVDDHREDYEKEIDGSVLLSKMGFDNVDAKVKTLSGGWRKRLAIARQIVKKPNLLLMDEPTNHLDLEGIVWLEKYLETAPFAYLVVSHDRYFLENISTRVIELNRRYPQGHLSAEGSYSDFLLQREEFFAGQMQQQESLANRVRREVDWLKRGPKARTTKAKGRIKEARSLIGELGELKYRNAQTGKVDIDFTASDRKTKRLIVVEDLKKSFGHHVLFEKLNLTLVPGLKLGLLGLNGSGKTTLIKAFLGTVQPDSGTIKRAERLRVVFFDQARATLDTSLTLRRALATHGDQVVYRDSPLHVASWARKFLFSSEQLDMPIASLSGGERARILIAQLMLQPADVLILDEPTNDLDIPTLEVLEESLADFPGALVLVTHDRYLLDRVSTHLLALDGKGGVDFFSDYSQWEAAQEEKLESEKLARAAEKKSTVKDVAPKTKKLTYKDQIEWDQMEENIQSAEASVYVCEQEMQSQQVIADAAKLQEVCSRLKIAQDEVERLYNRWTELEEKQKA